MCSHVGGVRCQTLALGQGLSLACHWPGDLRSPPASASSALGVQVHATECSVCVVPRAELRSSNWQGKHCAGRVTSGRHLYTFWPSFAGVAVGVHCVDLCFQVSCVSKATVNSWRNPSKNLVYDFFFFLTAVTNDPTKATSGRKDLSLTNSEVAWLGGNWEQTQQSTTGAERSGTIRDSGSPLLHSKPPSNVIA